MKKQDGYYINQEQTIAQFFPQKLAWRRTLNSIELFHAHWFPQGSLYFKGDIDLTKLLEAFNNTLQIFYWMFARIHYDPKQIYVAYPQEANKNGLGIELEIEHFSGQMEQTDIARNIPQKINVLLREGRVHANGLPMAAFKITVCENGFILGYCFSHIFFDQASIVYFFRYLANTYSRSEMLPTPALIDIEEHFADTSTIEFSDLKDFMAQAKSMGFSYVENPQAIYEAMAAPRPERPITLYFNDKAIEQLKNETPSFISENDILQAIHAKIRAQNKELTRDQMLQFGFACNMRKRCGFGEEAIGNIGSFTTMNPISVEDIRRASISELALLNRHCISYITTEKYQREIAWFRQLRKFNQSPEHYFSSPEVDPLSYGQSNWASFNYQNISFDGKTPCALRTTPLPPQIKFSLIYFLEKNDHRKLAMELSVLPQQIIIATEFGLETGIYECRSI